MAEKRSKGNSTTELLSELTHRLRQRLVRKATKRLNKSSCDSTPDSATVAKQKLVRAQCDGDARERCSRSQELTLPHADRTSHQTSSGRPWSRCKSSGGLLQNEVSSTTTPAAEIQHASPPADREIKTSRKQRAIRSPRTGPASDIQVKRGQMSEFTAGAGSRDPRADGCHDPQADGCHDPQADGCHDPQADGCHDPQADGCHDPQADGCHDPETHRGQEWDAGQDSGHLRSITNRPENTSSQNSVVAGSMDNDGELVKTPKASVASLRHHTDFTKVKKKKKVRRIVVANGKLVGAIQKTKLGNQHLTSREKKLLELLPQAETVNDVVHVVLALPAVKTVVWETLLMEMQQIPRDLLLPGAPGNQAEADSGDSDSQIDACSEEHPEIEVKSVERQLRQVSKLEKVSKHAWLSEKMDKQVSQLENKHVSQSEDRQISCLETRQVSHPEDRQMSQSEMPDIQDGDSVETGRECSRTNSVDGPVLKTGDPATSCTASLSSGRTTTARSKPYMCDVCSSVFTPPGNIKSHVQCHSADKPYVCIDCGARFSWSGSLKSHMQTHTDTSDKPYTCHLCGTPFPSTSNLKTVVFSPLRYL
ncbi:hypothetical protein BaRGS_00034122 [Batillaria attramentaria]|uniref:C2H2-type domain-containing protein n=1 Tax=Batillaria attramentaria TaxID=370345 RepID=A0ABD0JIS2_9CAEN